MFENMFNLLVVTLLTCYNFFFLWGGGDATMTKYCIKYKQKSEYA